MISYMPRKNIRHEFVTVTPDGIRYRGNNFHSLNALIPWFKEHFRDPLPGKYMCTVKNVFLDSFCTRKHLSRMRTARLPTITRCMPGPMSGRPHVGKALVPEIPPPREQTQACENITFTQLRWLGGGGKNWARGKQKNY